MAPRGYSGGASRTYSGGAARAYSGGAPRAYSGGAPRAYSGGAARAYSGGAPRAYSNVRGFGGRVGVERGFGSRFGVVGPTRFFRPYYSFRPRLSLGFGLWAGYPFAYPYAYYDPFYSPYGYGYPAAYPPYDYAYPETSYPAYPPAAGYPASAPPPASSYPSEADSIGVQPGQANTGGLSFEVTPSTAQVFVDGTYVGTVGQFTPTSQPLGLTPGRHRVEIRAPGYRTITFDPDVVAGQVIPYQGTMER
jgi:PEGA domain